MSESDKHENGKLWGHDFFTEHRDRLQRRLRARLRNDADAQDLAQEAYLRLLRVAEKDFIRHPQTYLFRIANNLVYELYTNELPAERRADEKELEEVEAKEPSLEHTLEKQRQLENIEIAMRELSPKCQAVVSMRSRQGMSNREIADQLDISTEMVKKYMAKGIAHCRKRLSRFR